MKRWGAGLLLVLASCAGIVSVHSRSPRLITDTDTSVLLARLAERHNPWSWFITDWPLQNHFYRPITALSFELDRLMCGSSPAGFGTCASIYCAVCVLALFWLAREFTDRPFIAAAAALLFAAWHYPFQLDWSQGATTLAGLVAIVGLIRHGIQFRRFLPAVLGISFIPLELHGVHLREGPAGFYYGVLAWLPGRTASLMTLFVLCALASYARYVRLGQAAPLEPSPSDPPATRTSAQADEVPKTRWAWFVASILCTALALGSYEQAVTLPLLLLVVAFAMRATGFKLDWTLHLFFWLVLAGYVALRQNVLPLGPSTYQVQASRYGATVIISALQYIFPAATDAANWWPVISKSNLSFLTEFFYSVPWRLAGNLSLYWTACRHSKLAAYEWLLSCLAFLPMAFLKPFPHYHYLPMALRSMFVASLLGVVASLVVTAVSLPNLQAPRRLAPAPGSLPHR